MRLKHFARTSPPVALDGRGKRDTGSNAVLWLRQLGGKLGLKSDLDRPYVLLRGISAVWQTVATLTFAAQHPFPRDS